MVQWTAKPVLRDAAGYPASSRSLPSQPALRRNPMSRKPLSRKPLPHKRALTPLYVTVIGLIGAIIPASYLVMARPSSPPAPGHREPAAQSVSAGRIIIPDHGGCRELGFDNYSGQSVERGNVPCNITASKHQGLTERLESIRRAFVPQ